MTITPTRRLASMTVLLAMLGGVLVPPAAAVHDVALFELDGSLLDNPATPARDWSNVFPPFTSGALRVFIHEPDGDDESYFTSGGSKDVNDISQWKSTTNDIAPDKDEIVNAFASFDRGANVVYFGADRYGTSGDAIMGFWLFQNPIQVPTLGGNFGGVHLNGDVLLIAQYTQGGSVTNVTSFIWQNGSLVAAPGTGADCRSIAFGGNHAYCAIANNVRLTNSTNWPYQGKGEAQSGVLPIASFLEAGVNITRVSPNLRCFSNFLAETRSSTSPTAQLKDYALGTFRTCDARITLSPLAAVNPTGTPHVFTAHVERDFGSGPEAVANQRVNFTKVSGPGSFVGNAFCITDASGDCSVTMTSSTPGVTILRAEASVLLDTIRRVVTTGTEGNSANAAKTWVDARVRLTPTSAENPLEEPHVFTAFVEQNTGSGWVGVPGVLVTTTILSGPGVYDGASSCTTAGAAGSCTVTVTSSTPGTTILQASATPIVGGIPVTRTTGASADTPDAVKVWVAGRISLTPLDADNDVATEPDHVVTALVERSTSPGVWTPVGGILVSGSITGVGAFVGSPTCSTDASGRCDLVVTSIAAGVTTVHASADLPVGLTTFQVATGTGANPDAVKHWVDASIRITPLTAVNPLNQHHTFTIHLTVDDSETGPAPASGVLVTTSILSGPGTYVVGPTCTTNATGKCDVVVVSSTEGITVLHAEASIPARSLLLDRATGTLDSPDALKQWRSIPPPVVTTPTTDAVTLGGSIRDRVLVDGELGPGSGTVQFYICAVNDVPCNVTDGTPLGSPVTLDAQGRAESPPFTPTAAGAYCFAAAYSGGGGYSPGIDSDNLAECFTVFRAPTTTTTTPSALTPVLGDTVHDTAVVSSLGGSFPPATGSVSFFVCDLGVKPCTSGGTTLGVIALVSGSAQSLGFTPLAAGEYCFRGEYAGDDNYNASSDARESECFVVDRAPTVIVTTPSSSTFPLGGTVTDRADLSALGGAFPAPTGTISFFVCAKDVVPCATGGTPLGSFALSGAQATSDPYTPLATGTYCFRSEYSGDANYRPSSDSASPRECFIVTPAPTTTTTTPSSAVTLSGSIFDRAVIAGLAPPFPAPTGNVEFFLCAVNVVPCTTGGTSLGTVPLVGGAAQSVAVTPLAAGTYCFRAEYAGDANYQGSVDSLENECVNIERADPEISTTSDPTGTSALLGTPAFDTANVVGLGGAFPPATGTVTFHLCGPSSVVAGVGCVGGTQVGGPVALVNGVAISDVTDDTNEVGVYCWRAAYSGDENYNASSHTDAQAECFSTFAPFPSICSAAAVQVRAETTYVPGFLYDHAVSPVYADATPMSGTGHGDAQQAGAAVTLPSITPGWLTTGALTAVCDAESQDGDSIAIGMAEVEGFSMTTSVPGVSLDPTPGLQVTVVMDNLREDGSSTNQVPSNAANIHNLDILVDTLPAGTYAGPEPPNTRHDILAPSGLLALGYVMVNEQIIVPIDAYCTKNVGNALRIVVFDPLVSPTFEALTVNVSHVETTSCLELNVTTDDTPQAACYAHAIGVDVSPDLVAPAGVSSYFSVSRSSAGSPFGISNSSAKQQDVTALPGVVGNIVHATLIESACSATSDAALNSGIGKARIENATIDLVPLGIEVYVATDLLRESGASFSDGTGGNFAQLAEVHLTVSTVTQHIPVTSSPTVIPIVTSGIHVGDLFLNERGFTGAPCDERYGSALRLVIYDPLPLLSATTEAVNVTIGWVVTSACGSDGPTGDAAEAALPSPPRLADVAVSTRPLAPLSRLEL